MLKIIKRRSKKAGLPPGSLVHVGEKRAEKVTISIIDYDEEHFEERSVEKVEECCSFKDSSSVSWINIVGLHEVDIIDKIGKQFGLHPLIIEDILNTEQRPKIEDYGEYIFIVTKMLFYKENEIESEQISIILGPNYVLTFQEREGDVFDAVRTRIKENKGKVRKSDSDYLTYTLIDAVVDNYFLVLEKVGESIEQLEEELLEEPTPETLNTIHNLKRDLIFLRKSVWPLREVINTIYKGESKLIKSSTRVYLRDVYDHTIQVVDVIETFRDTVSGMLDVYLSSVSNRMNEIMKVLTMIATVFIPLTFIAGVYGMNFQYMPELGLKWAYPFVWTVMLAIVVTMFIYFRKKGWL
ncbi:MAG: magnesium/cobalt transporter CorA [Archaeoglobaceae archaeon]